jgi:NAD(P)-dependent dehydrogenase (short-subunit alcohol dehydrogenase family)
MSATVAIVAGGGGPLGHATAVALAADGLTVVAVDRTEHALSDLPEDIRREVADATGPRRGGAAHRLPADPARTTQGPHDAACGDKGHHFRSLTGTRQPVLHRVGLRRIVQHAVRRVNVGP